MAQIVQQQQQFSDEDLMKVAKLLDDLKDGKSALSSSLSPSSTLFIPATLTYTHSHPPPSLPRSPSHPLTLPRLSRRRERACALVHSVNGHCQCPWHQ